MHATVVYNYYYASREGDDDVSVFDCQSPSSLRVEEAE